MSRGALPLAAECSTGAQHEFQIPAPRGPVAGLTLHCPNCAGPADPSPLDELAEMIAARRLTLAGLATLPAAARAGLHAGGTLDQFYLGTVLDVGEVARRCGAHAGRELPPVLRSARRARQVTAAQATNVLDAAAGWLACLRG